MPATNTVARLGTIPATARRTLSLLARAAAQLRRKFNINVLYDQNGGRKVAGNSATFAPSAGGPPVEAPIAISGTRSEFCGAPPRGLAGSAFVSD